VLGVLEGMSYQELAEISGCAVGTAKSRVFRARRQLETWLTADPAPAGRREGIKNLSGKTLSREKSYLSPMRNGPKHGKLEQSRSRAGMAGV
jgi:RNA polymerase sigma-70 factor (ECF subfamily)